MKKRLFSGALLALVFSVFTFVSCSSDDNSTTQEPSEGGGEGDPNKELVERYVIGASASSTSLLLTVQDLKKGSISVNGNGVNALGTTVYTHGGNRAYVFEYRKGDPSGSQSWLLNDKGQLTMNTKLDLPTREEFIASMGKYMIATTGGVTLDGEDPNSNKAQAFNFIDGATGEVAFTSYVNVQEIAEKGEYANFAGLETIGNNRFVMAIEPMKLNSESTTSDHRDSAWLAIFKFNENAENENDKVVLEKVVKSDKMSFAVARYRSSRISTIGKAGDGNVYLFSPNATDSKGVPFSSKPSAVIKFDSKKGDFDPGYYYDLEAISGTKVYKAFAIGGENFLLNMFVEPSNASNRAPANKLAVFNVITGDFKWVEGLPEAENIAVAGTPFVENEEVFIPVTAESKSNVYVLDPNTATVTKGLEIKDLGDGSIGTIGKISNK
ncbi:MULTISPECIES: DUF4374 domain-containing protein [Myroides]|uniref:DUF4374 domain-containing protein n=1 Tax=Myroides albus TaxID=2562892 RepID=A0A6I3LLG0_9FLAO|nr:MULTISPECIES: DUF4374 domain-containing protein [Myroides]MTG98684.1 DUF4374 domain-containing protein [Myroides albus]MVX37285.1 DUF4374 domain-containing protein [Myroides sp. LoEW2-1]UVD78820.1 DUF4374 domain-containing protein [Myroides albus]